MKLFDVLMIFLPLVFLLLMLGGVWGWLRRKDACAKSAAMGCGVSRRVEGLIFLAAAVVSAVVALRLNRYYGVVLYRLDELRPEYARTHVILAAVICLVLVAGFIACLRGRTSLAVVLSLVTVISYAGVMNRCPMNQVGYLMTLIAPEGSWEPIIKYTFKLKYPEDEPAELWLNDIYMGKLPLTISGRQLYTKITEPGKEAEKGFRKAARDREMCEILMLAYKSNDYEDGHYWYTPDHERHFAKVLVGGKQYPHRRYARTKQLNEGSYKYDLEVSIQLETERSAQMYDSPMDRLEKLFDEAVKNGYRVDDDWKAAILAEGHNGMHHLNLKAEKDEGFVGLLDEWARSEFGVGAKEPREVYDEICRRVAGLKHFDDDSLEYRAIGLIYDGLDYERIVKEYKKAYKKRSPGTAAAVASRVLKLWDRKLDAENPYEDNFMEKEIVLTVLAYKNDVGTAAAFGGSVFENYLLRQYRREQRVEGIELGYENYMYEGGQHLNKWLYHLVHLDSPTGRKFRRNNSTATLKMAKVMLNSMHNLRKDPPEFLFIDLDMGKRNIAVKCWEEYLIAVEDSFPGWEPDKFEKRLKYLLRLGDLATDDMYRQCWQYVNLKELFGDNRIVKVLDPLGAERKKFMAKIMLDSISGNEKVANNLVITRALKAVLEKGDN